MRDERLCLVSPANEAPAGPVALRQLAKYPLVMPERGHSFRKLMESAAAMAGVQLRVEWEVSSVPAILDLVGAGIGHAALSEDAIRPLQHQKRLVVTPFVQPGIKITLCLVTPAQRRSTPLRQRTAELLAAAGARHLRLRRSHGRLHGAERRRDSVGQLLLELVQHLVAGQHLRDAGSSARAPSRIAAKNSRSCSSMPFIETSTFDDVDLLVLAVEQVVVAGDVGAGVADVAEEGAERARRC